MDDMDEETPLLEDDAETSFIDLTNENGTLRPEFVDDRNIPQVLLAEPQSIYETPLRPTNLRRDLLRQTVEKLYDHLGLDKENLELNLDRFKLENEDGVNILYFEKNGRWFNLSKKTDGNFKAKSALGKIFTKKNLVQLGTIKQLDEIVPTSRELEQMSHEELASRLQELTTLLKGVDLREIKGLDEFAQRKQGEFVNGSSKLTEIEQKITDKRQKLEASVGSDKTKIERELKQLQEAYEVRLESLSQLKPELSSQLSRFRQTIDKIADKNRTLKERLKILWREQGVTIVSVLTALGMTISTLVLALLPRGGAAAVPSRAAGDPSGGSPHRVRDWVKKSFKSLGRLLGRLASWALKTLPGVLGSFLSWLFNLLKKTIMIAADHAYAVIGAIGLFGGYILFQEVNKGDHRKRT